MTANETVREVCAESKDWDSHSWLGVNEHEYVVEIADRILSAHEREMASKDAEIAHLKSALEPVMECGEIELASAPYDAVRKAKNVMRKGGEK